MFCTSTFSMPLIVSDVNRIWGGETNSLKATLASLGFWDNGHDKEIFPTMQKGN